MKITPLLLLKVYPFTLRKHVVKLLSQTGGVTIIIAYVGSINSYPFLKGDYPFLFNIFNISM